ncbi:ethanolaminephosphotransferase 1 [Macrophomina phaseolina]|uniref:Ethanolaminephosphotransferase 1 n=1 Tax=Macrophomina phaseolina TaxID=35725 RepID=A0ABQ8GNC8_9PEZI|nr:ethanolaminephosphotransferase 1 [Macrophomina phaseolina]
MGKSKSGDLESQIHDQIQSRYTAAHECVSEEALAHLKTYKYSSVDKSFVSRYILKHYWNAFVELLPLWLAPNMVTLLGFFFILANVGLLELFVPDLVGPAPTWIYYSFAFGLWMYSTMDNVDGKQARRTGTSSGLGELFDHGIDSLNCTLGSLLETAAMGYGATKTGAFTALIPCLPMFFSTWETYHTHTLYLGYFNGPTEGLIIACSMMIMSAHYGPEIWSSSLIRYFPSLEGYISPMTTFRDFWVPILLGSFFIAHLPACVVNVARARRAEGKPVLPVFQEWTPMIVFTLATCAWLGSPYSTILEEWDAKNKTGGHLVLWCLTMSLVFGRMTTKIILAHLTRQPFPYWTVMLVPLVGGAVLVNLPRVGLAWGPAIARLELWYLRSYFVFAAVVYTNWAVLVVTSICKFLGINCLTIAPKKENANGRATATAAEPERRATRSMANGATGRKAD